MAQPPVISAAARPACPSAGGALWGEQRITLPLLRLLEPAPKRPYPSAPAPRCPFGCHAAQGAALLYESFVRPFLLVAVEKVGLFATTTFFLVNSVCFYCTLWGRPLSCSPPSAPAWHARCQTSCHDPAACLCRCAVGPAAAAATPVMRPAAPTSLSLALCRRVSCRRWSRMPGTSCLPPGVARCGAGWAMGGEEGISFKGLRHAGTGKHQGRASTEGTTRWTGLQCSWGLTHQAALACCSLLSRKRRPRPRLLVPPPAPSRCIVPPPLALPPWFVACTHLSPICRPRGLHPAAAAKPTRPPAHPSACLVLRLVPLLSDLSFAMPPVAVPAGL